MRVLRSALRDCERASGYRRGAVWCADGARRGARCRAVARERRQRGVAIRDSLRGQAMWQAARNRELARALGAAAPVSVPNTHTAPHTLTYHPPPSSCCTLA